MNPKRHALLPFLVAIACNHLAAQENQPEQAQKSAAVKYDLPEVVVTASAPVNAHEITLDPKLAVQPLPAADGAGLLKIVPNMNVIRKGGMSGDLMFRGLGGSRLSISSDDAMILGGCGGRMDPPTAYISPESYDRIRVLKGPSTVTEGPGVIAGVVRFEHDAPDYKAFDYDFNSAVTLGSFDRRDAFADVQFGDRLFYARANINHVQSDDYKDGGGNRVHSSYRRNSQSARFGLTPFENTRLEVSFDRSRGYAAYADRMMDGTKFDRDAWRLELNQDNISDIWRNFSIFYAYNEIDHVMDNYSYRPTPKIFRTSNPKRKTQTAGLSSSFELGKHNLQWGLDWSSDRHESRMQLGNTLAETLHYQSKPYMKNQYFKNRGIFLQDEWVINEHNRLIGGIRYDQTTARYDKHASYQTPDQKERDYDLTSGFLRYEWNNDNITAYAALGSAERAPDFWERNRSPNLGTERNNEIDFGLIYSNRENLSASLNVFASKINDFILIDNNSKPNARHVDAKRFGFEGTLAWDFAPNWQWDNQMSLTWAKNTTDDTPLPQTPPFEWTSALKYDNDRYFAAFSGRFAASQNRIVRGQGNIAGIDTAPTASFTVFSLHGGMHYNDRLNFSLGVDNLFDKRYRESVNKGAFDVMGYDNPFNDVQINEPGRQYWLRFHLNL